jgi:hypothetical protein
MYLIFILLQEFNVTILNSFNKHNLIPGYFILLRQLLMHEVLSFFVHSKSDLIELIHYLNLIIVPLDLIVVVKEDIVLTADRGGKL